MKNLKPGDPVKHSEGGDKIDALFVGYYTSQSSDCKGTENRVIVRYAGDVKKSNGDWLEKYCVPRNAGDSLPKSELSLSDHIDEVHDKLESKDPVLTKEQKQVMDSILNYSKPLCKDQFYTKNASQEAWYRNMMGAEINFSKLVDRHKEPAYNADFSKLEERVLSNLNLPCNNKNALAPTAIELQYELRGNMANMLIDDKVGGMLKRTKAYEKYNDKLDALAYSYGALISIDWAEGFGPTSEKKMKAEIKTLYTNGVLTQTLINDRDVATEEPSFFLSQVNNAEAAIEKLEKHKSASEFAANEIKRLKNFVVQVYNLLDDKFAAD